MKITSRVDSLDKGPRLLAWVGMSLVGVLVLTLVQSLIGDPTFGWSMGSLFVVFLAGAGYWGSEFRNRHRKQYDDAVLTLRRRTP